MPVKGATVCILLKSSFYTPFVSWIKQLFDLPAEWGKQMASSMIACQKNECYSPL